ncbi:hypothetical protein [Crocosphaera watsonii]|nr:hypothetical protein CWATWH0003_5058 [Crocosphaera watsonii WH 0003]CCQ51409.1 FIG00561270: hypothetical protein [Crocosphaera watsonii WH 8502]CCQ69557.1 hypothetical protein CWATWH0402_935 [Crocosphaera watsonii WH 0402]
MIAVSCLIGFSVSESVSAQILAQETPSEGTEVPEDDPSDPSNLRPLTQADSLLSLQGGEKLMNEAGEAINQENYDLAVTKLQQARKVFNQLSNFYLQLANSFSGIDTEVYDSQRDSALKTGQMRDAATYQLALVHRAQDQPELAVPLLVQIIRSQNPTTDLGKKSYQQLYELGFVDVPFADEAQATSSN